MDTFQSILIGAVAGLASAVLTYFSTRGKIRLELAAEYDKNLQENRLATYQKLWAMLEPLATFGRDEPVTYAVIRKISTDTRKWYFREGGIYLTERSRKPYFHWKKVMQEVLDDPDLAAQPDLEIGEFDTNKRQQKTKIDRLGSILGAGSSLRTALSDDIGTKRLSRL